MGSLLRHTHHKSASVLGVFTPSGGDRLALAGLSGRMRRPKVFQGTEKTEQSFSRVFPQILSSVSPAPPSYDVAQLASNHSNGNVTVLLSFSFSILWKHNDYCSHFKVTGPKFL